MIEKPSYGILEIGSETCSNATLLGGRVDADEDEVGVLDAFVHIGGEEEIAVAGLADDIFEIGLIYWKFEFRVVPSVDAVLIKVDYGDLNVRTFESNDGAGRTACVNCIAT